MRPPTRSLCCQRRRKIRNLHRALLVGCRRATGNLKFPRQHHRAPRNLPLPLAGGRTNPAGPSGTKSRRSNWHILNAPLFNDIRNLHLWPCCCFDPKGAIMIPSLTSTFGTETAQDNPIPTSTQITHDLTCACRPHQTQRSIDGTRCDAISNGHRLRQHCQAGLWEETPLCKVRAPNKVLLTEQHATHSFFLNGDTIINLSPQVAGPRITSAVNWNTWNNTVSWAKGNNTWKCKTTCKIGYDTIFLQVVTSTETNLCRTKGQGVPYVKATPRGPPLQLPLFLHKRLVFSPARFNFAPYGPPLL